MNSCTFYAGLPFAAAVYEINWAAFRYVSSPKVQYDRQIAGPERLPGSITIYLRGNHHIIEGV